ncbi:MAG: alpha-E domain-containing protein [Acidobacteriota bacterium]|nr:alpha-E domain-containing protein [Acidobacteriota bacterium]
MRSSETVLSRLAESLYWIGRYVERADDTARILDSYVHRMVEDPLNDENEACRSLYSILGMDPGVEGPITVTDALESIAYDDANPSSIAGALYGAYQNARRSRDVISSEMWVALNATQLELAHAEATSRRLGPATYLAYVRERTALFTGLTDSTLSRDDGWRFLTLGQCVERVDMTARLLRARAVSDEHAPDWLAFLRASGAMEAYMRSTSRLGDANGIAAFLLLDRIFPRSCLFALNRADALVVELQPDHQRIAAVDHVRQSIARARATLEFVDAQHVLSQLGDLLELLELTCLRLDDAITERFFHRDAIVNWHSEGAT